MNTRWIVVASNVGAKIFSTHPQDNGRLKFVTELDHPDGLKHNKDFTTDRPGHFKTNHATHGSFEQKDEKEIENDNFARKLAEFLEAERNNNQFHSLTLVMLPHFHGLIEHHLDKHVKTMVDKVIQKNYIDKTIHELEEIIREA